MSYLCLSLQLLSEMWSKEVPTAFNAVNITSFALPSDRNEMKKLLQIKKSFANDFREKDMPSVSSLFCQTMKESDTRNEILFKNVEHKKLSSRLDFWHLFWLLGICIEQLEEALALDATQVLLQAFNLIIQSQINISKALETESVVSTVNFTRKTIDPTCPTLKPFKFGEIIANHLKIVSIVLLSFPIHTLFHWLQSLTKVQQKYQFLLYYYI